MIAMRINNILNKIDERVDELVEIGNKVCASKVLDDEIKKISMHVTRIRITELSNLKEYIVEEID